MKNHPLLWMLFFIIVGFIYHPKWMNILLFVIHGNPRVPLNYVANFYLWTRSNKHTAEIVTLGPSSFFGQTVVKRKRTFVLIHGFTKTGLEPWILQMKDALLWREDCNVVSVDWDAGSITASYYVIRDRVPGVGQDVATFLEFLQQQSGISGPEIHLIGHSLGAHIAGFAGKHWNDTIGRITGLDPAGLAFNGATADGRLDKTDAAFVDVIHTNGCYTVMSQLSDCYGIYENIGHADFWPNGGERQPACDKNGDGQLTIQAGSNCDHGIVHSFYTNSVYYFPSSTRFLARKCDSFAHFNNGSCPCPAIPQYMGHNANPSSHGRFYLNTTDFQPYGKLEPTCSASERSSIKILGILLCISLLTYRLALNIPERIVGSTRKKIKLDERARKILQKIRAKKE